MMSSAVKRVWSGNLCDVSEYMVCDIIMAYIWSKLGRGEGRLHTSVESAKSDKLTQKLTLNI